MLHGIDIAAGNGLDKTKYAADFGIVKSTESTNYHNPNHPAQVAALRNAGKLVGHYHFLHSQVSGEEQAKYFLAHTTIQPGDIVACDWEQTKGTVYERTEHCLSFLRHVKAALNVSPLVYSYPDFLRQIVAGSRGYAAWWEEIKTYPLWIAEYNGKDMVDSRDMYGWTVWSMHQNADQPYVDRDVFNGDRSTWARLAVPHKTSPKPQPKPVVKPVVEIHAPTSVTVKVIQK